MAKGSNPRFVVTNLDQGAWPARELYERLYCARGEMENRIKEQQLFLFAGRISPHMFRANRLRLWFSSVAYLVKSPPTNQPSAVCGGFSSYRIDDVR